ncbi:Os11g0228850, partial [Oryza sativa Japonica Group]
GLRLPFLALVTPPPLPLSRQPPLPPVRRRPPLIRGVQRSSPDLPLERRCPRPPCPLLAQHGRYRPPPPPVLLERRHRRPLAADSTPSLSPQAPLWPSPRPDPAPRRLGTPDLMPKGGSGRPPRACEGAAAEVATVTSSVVVVSSSGLRRRCSLTNHSLQVLRFSTMYIIFAELE